MRFRYLFFAALFAVVVATGLFAAKIAKVRDNQDELEDAMHDIRAELLRSNSAAAYQDFGLDNETRFRIKFALAPARLCTSNFLTDSKYDTLLSAFPGTAPDSLRATVLNGRQIILERRDRSHFFVLSKKIPG